MKTLIKDKDDKKRFQENWSPNKSEAILLYFKDFSNNEVILPRPKDSSCKLSAPLGLRDAPRGSQGA